MQVINHADNSIWEFVKADPEIIKELVNKDYSFFSYYHGELTECNSEYVLRTANSAGADYSNIILDIRHNNKQVHMKTKTSNKTHIKRLRALEVKAQKLQSEIDNTHTQWQSILDHVRATQEWQDDCDMRGFVTNPKWGDVLC